MFFKSKIRNRVMDTINQKIDACQQAHDEHVKMLEDKLEADKKSHEDLTVNSLVGKFL